MVKKKSESGVAALVDPPEAINIQDIRMIDWYAAFALFNIPLDIGESRRAQEAFEQAHAMMKEREKYI